MQASDLIAKIEEYAPRMLAYEKDPIGLQIGDPNKVIHRVMTTLDVRPEVVEEAIEKNVDFIVAHHPVMFRPAKNLDFSDPQNAMYAKLIQHDIVVYAAHTNLDAARNGLNDWLAEDLGIHKARPLLANSDGMTGIGRIGMLEEPMTVEAFAERVRQEFHVSVVRVIANDLEREIQRIAVIGGDGGKEYREAIAARADALVTADVYYHTGHDILSDDFVVIDPDHHMEAIVKPRLVNLVEEWNQEEHWQLEAIFMSGVNTDPYRYI